MFASPWKDTLVILVIVLLFVGPKRLPALSRSIGESIREFKGGISDISGSHGGSELNPGAGSGTASPPPATVSPATVSAATGSAPPVEESRVEESRAVGASRDQAGA